MAEKDGWYVSADLLMDPPRVILTEKPGKGSRWAVVDTPKGYGARFFFRNEDAPGGAVWLTIHPEGKIYRGGVARQPILSDEQNDYFWIGDADSGK